jgi:hypothetical protein
MAFVFPVVVLVMLATFDLAQLVYSYGAVAEASRCGARYAIVHGSMAGSPVGPTANNATVASVVKANAPALDPTRLTVTSSWGNGTNAASNPVTVTVSYQCNLPASGLLGLGNVTVSSSTTMTITH